MKACGFLFGLLMVCAGARAQEYRYDVSTVRPNTSGTGNTSVNTNNDSYTSTNQGFVSLVENAFKLQTPEQVIGLPAWALDAHYDIKAKIDPETQARLKLLNRDDRGKADDEMMVKLLVDRFALKYHHESREQAEYALLQAKSGSRLKPADTANPKAGSMFVHNGKMEAYSAEMKQLGYFLSFQVHRFVVDRTGLTGKYDLALEWSRDDAPDTAGDRAPGLFTALEEQMGLKLESTKGPVDTIVIDHIEQPTEN